MNIGNYDFFWSQQHRRLLALADHPTEDSQQPLCQRIPRLWSRRMVRLITALSRRWWWFNFFFMLIVWREALPLAAWVRIPGSLTPWANTTSTSAPWASPPTRTPTPTRMRRTQPPLRRSWREDRREMEARNAVGEWTTRAAPSRKTGHRAGKARPEIKVITDFFWHFRCSSAKWPFVSSWLYKSRDFCETYSVLYIWKWWMCLFCPRFELLEFLKECRRCDER